MNDINFSEAYLAHHGVKGMKWGVRRRISRDGQRVARSQAKLESNHRSNRSRQRHIKKIHNIYKKYETSSKSEKTALEKSRNLGLRKQMVYNNRGYVTGLVSGDRDTKKFTKYQMQNPTGPSVVAFKRSLAIGLGVVAAAKAYNIAVSRMLIKRYSSYVI